LNEFFSDALADLQYLQSQAELLPQSVLKPVESAIKIIHKIQKKVQDFNQVFVTRRKLEYQPLWAKSQVNLADDQLLAIITDEKHNLVVAGAGSGKTEVLITRIAYLVKRQPDTVDPSKILALAYQRKNSIEIRKRLSKRFDADINVNTFHALGKSILEQAFKLRGRKPPTLKFSGDNLEKEYTRFIEELLQSLQEDTHFQNQIINYMKYYADDKLAREELDFETKE